jgi:hypothetical protein
VGFSDSQKTEKDYFEALGRFVHAFSIIELSVFTVLTRYSGLSPSTSNALLSGVRIDGTFSRLRRLHQVNVISDKDWVDLEYVFNQLSVINGCRNELLHQGADLLDGDEGIVTNTEYALTPKRIKEFPISYKILHNMFMDLQKISIHLRVRHMGGPPWDRASDEDVLRFLRSSWRYKRPPGPQVESQPPEHRDHR